MIPEGHPNVRQAVWEDIGPAFVSRLGDLLLGLMVLTGIGVLHLAQLVMLKFGWSPEIVHWLDEAEEWAAFVTIASFLISSAFSFLWTLGRRTLKGLK